MSFDFNRVKKGYGFSNYSSYHCCMNISVLLPLFMTSQFDYSRLKGVSMPVRWINDEGRDAEVVTVHACREKHTDPFM